MSKIVDGQCVLCTYDLLIVVTCASMKLVIFFTSTPTQTWLAAQPTTHDASSPDSIVASRAVMPDVELLDTVLFNEHDWPLPC